MSEIWVVRAGSVPYAEARAIQRELERARAAGEIADVLLLLEHPPVYTKTRRSTAADLPMGEDWYRAQGIEVADTDRGGLVTYHGPGQLVAYPIMSLFELEDRDDVHAYIRRMEDAIIAALGDWGVEARVFAGLTGVWAPSRRRRAPRARSGRSASTSAPGSPPMASRSTSTTICSRSNGSRHAGSRPCG
jgi:lipoyl(octanoyl) transferase